MAVKSAPFTWWSATLLFHRTTLFGPSHQSFLHTKKEHVMTDERRKQEKEKSEKSPDNHDLGKELIETGGPIFDTPEGEDKKKKDKDAG